MKKAILLILFVLAVTLSGCTENSADGNKASGQGEVQVAPPANEVEPTHWECSDQQCVEVNGAGQNKCETDSNCFAMENYVCRGFVKNSLCYYGTEPITPNFDVYEDDKIKVYSTYPERTPLNNEFEFLLTIENKLDAQIKVKYNYSSNSAYEGYENTGIQNFSGAILAETKKGTNFFELTLSPKEQAALTGRFIPRKPNIFSNANTHSFIFFRFDIDGIAEQEFNDLSFSFKSIAPFEIENNPEDYIVCGGEVFPKSYAYDICTQTSQCGYTGSYQKSKCCDNVFYPGFECCNDTDCSKGVCVDGKCIKEIFQGMSFLRDPAAGTKKTLFIVLNRDITPNASEACSINNTFITSTVEIIKMTQQIEGYFDEMAKIHLGKGPEFIDFNFDYLGPFTLGQLGLNNSANQYQILDAIENFCNLNNLKDKYDEIIITGAGISNLTARGFAGKPIISIFALNTIVHELTHNFGCWHINNFDMGATLQWGKDLMGWSRRHDSTIKPTLQVCRGEMGWVDIDKDGTLDVLEVKS